MITSFKNYLIFSAEESTDIAKSLGKELLIPYIEIKIDHFPDRELSIKLPVNITGKNIIYIKSTPYPQDTNLMELFLTLDAFRQYKVKKIVMIIPYYAYARQDKIFGEGQSKSAETIAKIIESIGHQNITLYTIDVHFNRDIGLYKLFSTDVESYNISAVKELSTYIKKNYKPKNVKIVIPDKGHQPTHTLIKEVFDTAFIFLSKQRLSTRKVKIYCDQDTSMLKTSDIIIFDDMIGTGGTIKECIKWLKKQDVNRIFIAATHLMYPYNIIQNNYENISKKLRDIGATEIISTNTTSIKGNPKISVAPLIKRALTKRIYA